MKRMFGGVAAMVGVGLLAFGFMAVPSPIGMDEASAKFVLMCAGGALLMLYAFGTFSSAARRDRATG